MSGVFNTDALSTHSALFTLSTSVWDLGVILHLELVFIQDVSHCGLLYLLLSNVGINVHNQFRRFIFLYAVYYSSYM